MTLVSSAVYSTIWGLSHILCRIDDAQLTRVPTRGPLILVTNHINFLDAPLIYTHLLPRTVTAMAKTETWDNPLLGFLFSLGGAIPLRRGEADVGGVRRALAVLEAGHILAVAPEGTRSNHGRLQPGHPGVTLLALRSGAPLLPVAHYGGEGFRRNVTRLRRTSFHIVVGRPFYLDAHGQAVTRQLRQRMVDEIMCQLAALLPPAYRGHYAGLAASESYLRFPEGSQSNLVAHRNGFDGFA